MKSIFSLSLALLAAAAWTDATPAQAQDAFPSQPIRIVIPFGPGGATDFVARLVADKAKETLGQPVIVENKPGASGILAIEEMARSEPDGYTLMIGNVTTNALTPVLYPDKMTIDYESDVIAVAPLMVAWNVLITTAAEFEPKTFEEFVEYAKQNPGQVRYGTNGIGSFMHYDTELLASRLGIELNHIPYRDAGSIMKAVLSGEVQVTFLSTPITIPQAQAGAVHVIAHIDERLEQFPDVPRLADLGIEDVGTGNWQAVFAPAGTPPEVVELLHRVLTDTVHDPEIMKAAEKTGTQLFTADSAAEAQQWLRDELAKWRRITQEVQIDLN